MRRASKCFLHGQPGCLDPIPAEGQESDNMGKSKFPPEYRAILKRWNELCAMGKYGLTLDECAEMETLGAQLDAYELAHKQEANTIALAASDYDQCRAMGDLGGVELT
jgi:hypothetical protein